MSMSVSASSSNALSYLQSLLQQGTSGSGDAKKSSASDPLAMLMQAISEDGTSSGQSSSSATASNATTGSSCAQFSADTMSALLSAQGQQSTDSPDAKLFAKLDTNGDGTVSKDEFSAATSKAGVDSSLSDAVFSKMDANGDGSVTQDELTKADQAGGQHHHHHVHGGGGGAQGAGGAQDPLEAMLSSATASGATTQTSTNADGSTTTTLSYADGSKIDMTTPAAQSSDTSSGSSTDSSSNSSTTKSTFNLLEQLIKLQAQMLTTATSTVSAIA